MSRIVLTDLKPASTYTLQLKATDGLYTSEWSRLFTISTSSDVVAPATPTGLAAVPTGTAFDVSWNVVTLSADGNAAYDLHHYELEVSNNAGSITKVYQITDNKYTLSFEDNIAIFGTPQAIVKFRVRAMDQTSNASAYSSQVTATNAAPGPVTSLAVAALVDSIQVSWIAPSDNDLLEYRVYTGTSSGFTPTTVVWAGKTTGVTLSSSSYGADVFVKVAAVDVFGTLSTFVVSSAVRPKQSTTVDTTAPGVPTGLTATITTASDLQTTALVSWTAVTDTDLDLAYYVVGYRKTGTTDWNYVTVDYTNTSTLISGLVPYINYDFRIRSADFSANLSAWSTTFTSNTAATDTAPSQPAAPTVASSTQRLLVSHDKTKSGGGALESDVILLDVHASTTTGFTADNTNKIGTIDFTVPNPMQSFFIPATSSTPAATNQTWYVKVFAVDRGGNKSVASAQATATPGLIDSTSIIDATISDAKIGTLSANKLTAGTGIINDITVKSILTLGDASTTGVIKSYGYVAGTTGFSLSKTLLEINEGAIAAAALKIQSSPNLMPAQYSAFEFSTAFYIGKMPSGANLSVLGTGGVIGSQYLSIRAAFAAATETYLGDSATDYNITVEAGRTYIVSAWMKAGPVTSDAAFHVRWSDGSFSSLFGTTTLSASGAWQRVTGTITVPAGISSMVLTVYVTTATINAGVDVDGVQVEMKIGAINTPSTYSMPGNTSISGYGIRTGEIRSTATVTVNSVAQPTWSINLGGGAQFGDAAVRGKILVGAVGADVDAGQSYISSGNFSTGITGWKIDSSGNAEFNTGVFRGSLGVGVVSTNPVIDPSFEENYALGARGTDGWRQMSTVGTVTSAKVAAGARSGQWALKYAPVTPTYRENLVINPSFEVNAANWYNSNNAVLSRSTAITADQGSATLAIVPINLAATSMTVLGEYALATAGLVYSASIRARLQVTAASRNFTANIGFYDVNKTLLGTLQPSSTTALTTTFATFNITNKTAPAGTVYVRFVLGIGSTGGFTSSDVVHVDSALIEQSATNNTYFDGSTADSGGTLYGWSGPIGRSISWSTTSQAVYRSAIFPLNKGSSIGTNSPYKISLYAAAQTHGGRISVKIYVGSTYATTTTLLVDPTDIDNVPITKAAIGAANFSSTVAPLSSAYLPISTVMTIPSTAAYAVVEIIVDGPGPVFIDDVALIRTGLGGSSELSPAGLRLFDINGTESGAFVSNRPNSFSITTNGQITAQISDEGRASFQDLEVAHDPMVQGTKLSTLLGKPGQGVVAWGGIYNDATSTNTATGIGIFEIQAVLKPGRLYKVVTGPLRINASVGNSLAEIQVRYTTAAMPGTAAIPTITSPIAMRQQVAFGTANIAGDALQRIFNTNGQTGDLSMRLLLTYSAPVGGATFTMAADGVNDFIEMWVEDCGPYFGNLQIANDGSGTSGTPPTRYTSVWTASAWQNYKGDGTQDTRLFTAPPIVLQGYSPGGLGNESGILLFMGNATTGETNKTIATALSGATIESISVRIVNNWWAQDSGTARLGLHNQTTIPSTVPTITPAGIYSNMQGGTAWVFDMASFAGGWVAGTYKGIAVGPGVNTDASELGAFNADDATITITYTR